MLYTNNGDGTFESRMDELGGVAASFGGAFADVDNDGDLDLFVANRDNEDNFLYINEKWDCNNFACVKLIGNASNKAGIGAKIILTAEIGGEEVVQTHQVSSQTGGGTGGQNELCAHFGLGDASLIKSIMVIWPSGYKQEVTNKAVNQCHILEEEQASVISGFVYQVEGVNCDEDINSGSLPIGAQTAKYRTVAPGDWNSPATWVAGDVPPMSVIQTSGSIEHNVTHEGNLKFGSGARLYITNAGLIMEEGDFSMSNADVRLQGAKFLIEDGKLSISSQSGKLIANDSKITVDGNFSNYGVDTVLIMSVLKSVENMTPS